MSGTFTHMDRVLGMSSLDTHERPWLLAVALLVVGATGCEPARRSGSSTGLAEGSAELVEAQAHPTFAQLEPGSSVSVVMTVDGCYAKSEHRYSIEVGTDFVVEVEGAFFDRLATSFSDPEITHTRSGSTVLSAVQVERLDAALRVYREVAPSYYYAIQHSLEIDWPEGSEALEASGVLARVGGGSLDFLELAALAGVDFRGGASALDAQAELDD